MCFELIDEGYPKTKKKKREKKNAFYQIFKFSCFSQVPQMYLHFQLKKTFSWTA